MEGKLNAAVQHGFHLTAEQWSEVEQELNLCLKEHRITTEQYLAAMTEIKVLAEKHAAVEPLEERKVPELTPTPRSARTGVGSRGRATRHQASRR